MIYGAKETAIIDHLLAGNVMRRIKGGYRWEKPGGPSLAYPIVYPMFHRGALLYDTDGTVSTPIVGTLTLENQGAR